MRPLVDLFIRYRKRLAPLVVLVGLVVVGATMFDGVARETEIRYDLGPIHDSVVEARIAYLHEGQEVKGARFQWSSGAPQSVRHRVELYPGRYEIQAELLMPDGGQRSIRRILVVPAEGLVRMDLFDHAMADAGRRMR